MKILKFTLFCSLGVLLACSRPTKLPKITQTYTVAMTALHTTLHFTGIIQPLHVSTLTCPIDAIVETVHSYYGQPVSKGDIIFTLNSAELQRQYNDILTDYLKAKDAYSIAKSKFIGTEELWHAGLLSKNNYLNEKSSLNTMRLSLIQASRKLSEMLEKVGNNQAEDLAKLSFAEFDKVRRALDSKHNALQLIAPANGVLLYPPKTNDHHMQRVRIGSAIKAGQVVAMIGDLSGISVEIDIPEVDVSEIKIGMPATIRGVAFGNQELHGKLVAINAQASTHGNAALPSFTAIVEVHALSKRQQALIKVGMSASIELAIAHEDKLLIPISAVKQRAGQNIVQILNHNGQVTRRVVSTGTVSADKVAIDAGLKVGDVIVYG